MYIYIYNTSSIIAIVRTFNTSNDNGNDTNTN